MYVKSSMCLSCFVYRLNDILYFSLRLQDTFVLNWMFLLRSSLEATAASGGHRDSSVAKVSLSESVPEEEEEEEVRRCRCAKITLCFNNNYCITSDNLVRDFFFVL